MTIPDISQFQPWIQTLNTWHQDWFTHAFMCIKRYGFELFETSQANLNSGGILTFKKDDCYIDINRSYAWTELGYRPGLVLINETQDSEMQISVNNTMSTVHHAVRDLNIIE
jgi:hypothetical protein